MITKHVCVLAARCCLRRCAELRRCFRVLSRRKLSHEKEKSYSILQHFKKCRKLMAILSSAALLSSGKAATEVPQ